MKGYLLTELNYQCFGCEACAQVCPTNAITMQEDDEKFRYPVVDHDKCINCNRCHVVCPYETLPPMQEKEQVAYGGYHKDADVLSESTSGGAFSAIVEGWCDKNYVIFGACTNGTGVKHSFIDDKRQLSKFRQSKYLQSEIGDSYIYVKRFLKEGKKVVFSGTPCQVAGLKTFLGSADQENLLTVEVICEGVPTPHYINCLNSYITKKYGDGLQEINYRYKNLKKKKDFAVGKWDFQVMQLKLKNGRTLKKDRWFNPFWSIWLKHLMSRPSCYECPFATKERVADVSLGDLWGVHLYCQELYNHNAGTSLIISNTKKGFRALECAKKYLEGHELDINTAIKYQSPMRQHIHYNSDREIFMEDVKKMDYESLCKKWSSKVNIKLLWQKYMWGNRQKVYFWNLRNRGNKNA